MDEKKSPSKSGKKSHRSHKSDRSPRKGSSAKKPLAEASVKPLHKINSISSSAHVPQHLIKTKAYALLRTTQSDMPLKTQETTLGRDPQSPTHIHLTDSQKVSRIAARLTIDKHTDVWQIKNLSKNVILVDHHPLSESE
jgi:hypothetical protein